jgi:ribosome-associated protein
VRRSPSLSDEVRERLTRLAGKRITLEGILVIDARRFRTQERNRQDARDRLTELVRAATRKPRPRKATRPTLASKARRMDTKRKRADIKRTRRKGVGGE